MADMDGHDDRQAQSRGRAENLVPLSQEPRRKQGLLPFPTCAGPLALHPRRNPTWGLLAAFILPAGKFGLPADEPGGPLKPVSSRH